MPREHGQLQTAAKVVLRPAFRAIWKLDAVGLENIPASGPAILAPNHTSVIDSFFLPAVLPRRLTFVGKSEYLDSWKTRYLFPALGMIPIDRGGGHSARRALDTAAGLLEAGELFGIYPEGTRSRSGMLHRGHTGAARLAARTGAPIIPVGIIGSREIQPPGAARPRLTGRAEIRFGRPITASHGDEPSARPRHRELIDEVMYEIQALSGQQYVDVYANMGADAAGAVSGEVEQPNDPEMPERRSSAEVLGAAV